MAGNRCVKDRTRTYHLNVTNCHYASYEKIDPNYGRTVWCEVWFVYFLLVWVWFGLFIFMSGLTRDFVCSFNRVLIVMIMVLLGKICSKLQQEQDAKIITKREKKCFIKLSDFFFRRWIFLNLVVIELCLQCWQCLL